MAIIKNGILGNYVGKQGNVVGYELKGRGISRALPRARTSAPSDKEIANRKKFADLQHWLKPLTAFLRVGFHDYQPTFEGFVAAKSYNSKNAVTGVYPNFVVEPSLALVSFGNMAQPTTASAELEGEMSIAFSWSGGIFEHDDRSMLMAYDIENNRAVFDTAGPKHQYEKAILELNHTYKGKKVHIYLAFVAENRKSQSTSQYLGEITIPI